MKILQDQIGFKFFVQKLSGFAKFDLDTKITKLQFYHLIEELSHDEVAAEEGAPAEVKEGEAQQDGAEPVEPPKKKVFNKEKYDQVFDAWWKALRLETATPPFAGDLENPLYLSILAGIKSFKPELYVPPAEPEAPAEGE